MIVLCYYPFEILKALFAPDQLSVMCSSVLSMTIEPPTVSWSYYFVIFFLTCLMEAPIYFYSGVRHRQPIRTLLLQILLLNLATHPIVFWVLPNLIKYFDGTILSFVSWGESLAIFIEAFILKAKYRYSWKAAAWTAVLANLLSWTLGLWLQGRNLI